MRILVTGASGFLGKHVMARLLARYPEVEILGASTEIVDLTDLLDTESLFITRRPSLVFHLAAKVGGIEANRKSPGTFFRDNMLMGINVLEAARRYSERGGRMPRIVMVGTCCSYPRDAELPMKEVDIWEGYPELTNAPYGIAKRALLTMADGYRREFGMSITTAILANLYGPGDHFDLQTSHVIPGMIRRFIEAKESGAAFVTLWGDGSPTREFLYVDDAASALVEVGVERSAMDVGPVNVGSGYEIKISALALMIKLLVGYEGEVRWDTSKPNGQPRRVLDTFWLGPQNGTPLQDGLAKTVEWFLANRGA